MKNLEHTQPNTANVARLKEDIKRTHFKTFQSRTVKFDDLSHSHLSNMHWHNYFYEYIQKISGGPNHVDMSTALREVCIEKFGDVMPYYPHPDFTQEVKMLTSHKFLKENGVIEDWNGTVVGKMLPVHEREDRGDIQAVRSGIF